MITPSPSPSCVHDPGLGPNWFHEIMQCGSINSPFGTPSNPSLLSYAFGGFFWAIVIAGLIAWGRQRKEKKRRRAK